MPRSTKKHNYIRGMVQFVSFALFSVISINTVLFDLDKSGLSPVSLLGICPVGGVTALYVFITTGTVVSFMTIAVLLLSVLFGSVYCGWVCPLGTFQDFISKLTKKLHIKKYNNCIPHNVDKRLRLTRYGVLALVVYISVFSIIHKIRAFCIYNLITGFWTGLTATGGLIILIFIVVGTAVFVQRPWCKYLCPYGALLGMSNRFSLFKIKRKPSSCIDCKQCEYTCPMNIPVSERNVIKDAQCISCLRCTSESACPVKNTVTVGSSMKHYIIVRYKSLALLIMIVFTVSISTVYFNDVRLWASADSRIGSGNLAAQTDISVSQPIQSTNTYSDAKYRDGEYVGLAVAYRPSFKVLVSIENDRITHIEIVSHRETKGYYEESFELIPGLIIEKQSTQVDTISGATDTGNGIKKAVENALRKAAN